MSKSHGNFCASVSPLSGRKPAEVDRKGATIKNPSKKNEQIKMTRKKTVEPSDFKALKQEPKKDKYK